jgi:hypothetical protein
VALVVLLRGINVGGHRTFRPSRLADQLKHLDAVNIGAAGTFVIRRTVTRERTPRRTCNAGFPSMPDRDLPRARDPQADVSASVRESARAARRRALRERSLETPPFDALDAHEPSRQSPWLLKILAAHGRFVLGMYRRQMKVIGHLGALDGLFGVPVTTRNWNTITAIARVLEDGTS